jgi:hypothetical protein
LLSWKSVGPTVNGVIGYEMRLAHSETNVAHNPGASCVFGIAQNASGQEKARVSAKNPVIMLNSRQG